MQEKIYKTFVYVSADDKLLLLQPDAEKSAVGKSAAPVAFIMVALCNRADHYIFMLWFILLFFPRLISAVGDWMSTILRHMVWS